jgi:Skp family chaperone for outer membrane proteins
VKRAFGILAGIATLGAVAYLGTQVGAQQQYQQQQPQYSQQYAQQHPNGGATSMSQAAPLRTRVALVNLLQVIKLYTKCKACEDSIRAQFQLLDKKFEEKRKVLQAMKTELENSQTPADRRDSVEKQAKAIQREMQDMDEEAKQQLNKLRGDLAVQLYREIEDAVQAYARAQDIEMVLHYNDAVVSTDLYNPMNIQRKMQAGGCTPLYVAPGMDITMNIVSMLNSRYQAQQAPAAPRGN